MNTESDDDCVDVTPSTYRPPAAADGDEDNDDVVVAPNKSTTTRRRMSVAEERGLPSVRRAALSGVSHAIASVFVARQTTDTCLVHAIINATQRHESLDAMLDAVRREEGAQQPDGLTLDRRDITTGILAARRVLGVVIRCGFDFERDSIGIAHLNTPCGTGHFVALRRGPRHLCVLDSLDGSCRLLIDQQAFRRRCSAYHIDISTKPPLLY